MILPIILIIAGLALNTLVILSYHLVIAHKQKQIDALILGIQDTLEHVEKIKSEYKDNRIASGRFPDKPTQKLLNKLDKPTLRYYLSNKQFEKGVRKYIIERKEELIKNASS